jgi:TetR/AcrR family transcriptional repressor of bet genes
MSSREKTAAAAQPARETALRIRQRRKLIDACISALHAYGPSRTTIDKVVQIADMSPGIVNFYFDTKAAMLVAALEFLAAEFEQQVLAPVASLRATPVRALEALIDLYLDPELASPRKVSVWYAFWGEANSRQEYHDICGNKDDSFAALVEDLIERLIAETGARHLDADGVALGLIGALEVLWQHIAFQDESALDRGAYKRRCLSYLNSVFPGRFGAAQPAKLPRAAAAKPDAALPAWAYDDPGLFAAERDALFLGGWRYAGHEIEIPRAGDYLTFTVLGERVLAVRGADGQIRAFRNACLRRPHAVARGPHGHFDGEIRCPVDGAVYALDGGGLTGLHVSRVGGLIFVRLDGAASDAPPALAPAIGGLTTDGLTSDWLRRRGGPQETDIAADWKLVVEQWLESGFAPDGDGRLVSTGSGVDGGWTAERYGALTGRSADTQWRRVFFFPSLMVESRPDGVAVLQVLPLAPGQSCIRRFRYDRAGDDRRAVALAYLARRLDDRRLVAEVDAAQSTQAGLTAPLYQPGPAEADPHGAVRLFWRWLRARLPILADR